MARHVLLVTYSLELGGTGRAAVFVAGTCARAGWPVTAVADERARCGLPSARSP
jgi:hypothetical protein